MWENINSWYPLSKILLDYMLMIYMITITTQFHYFIFQAIKYNHDEYII